MFTDVGVPMYTNQRITVEIAEELAATVLADLRSDSATGPYLLPTRILK